MNKTFAIVVPVHNRERYIRDTLLSVVGQDYRPLHLVLVDNNSTDNSVSVAKEYLKSYEDAETKITFATEQKEGACAARNRGLSLTDAPYVMFLDDDDFLASYNSVSKIVEQFEATDADVVGFTAFLKMAKGKKRVRRKSFSTDVKEQILHCMFATQCFAIKRAFINQTGGWDERIKRWQDWNLGIRLLLNKPKVVWIESPCLVNIRVHGKSITGNGYLHSESSLYEAIMLTAESVKRIAEEGSGDICCAIYGRLPILAAHYLREGSFSVSKRAMQQYRELVELSAMQTFGLYLLYIYTLIGGRGAGSLINRFKVKLKTKE